MIHSYDKLAADIENVQQLPIVPTMLEVICRTTGMGFAAIARVTTDKWIACSVRDEIAFGLKPGGELQVETTICNEIRESHRAVIISNVAEDAVYCDHHTPKLYQIQSYISIPIILPNGEFFGTLCAIDPRPADLNNPKIIGMFNLFVELICFHLQSLDLLERNKGALLEMNIQLNHSIEENRQYRYISNHNLQEPLRKLRLFSNMLLDAVADGDTAKTKDFAVRINHNAKKVSMMIKDLSDFSELDHTEASFEKTDLNKVITEVCEQLHLQLDQKNATLQIGNLPVLRAIPPQMEQLFYHLVHNAIRFSAPAVPLVLQISAIASNQAVEIRITDNGIGIDQCQLEKIFDIFSQLSNTNSIGGFGLGLAYCRKIIHNHRGTIMAASEPGKGTTFSIVLPVPPIPVKQQIAI